MPTVQNANFIEYGRRFAKSKGLFRSGMFEYLGLNAPTTIYL